LLKTLLYNTDNLIYTIRGIFIGAMTGDVIADTVLVMERDRVQQCIGALDSVEHHFGQGYGGLSSGNGVFHGITGSYRDLRLSVIYSIGPAHVGDCVTFLVNYFDVTRLFATGSVGGIGSTAIGDIIVTNRVTTQDGLSFVLNSKDVVKDPVLGYQVEVNMGRTLTVSSTVCQPPVIGGTVHVNKSVYTIPAVCLETPERLAQIRKAGYAAIDLETGPFLSACKAGGIDGAVIHWVTDLPETFSFYYSGDDQDIVEAKARKYRQWLNMPRIVLPILYELI
jgi:uridine phosphorylase